MCAAARSPKKTPIFLKGNRREFVLSYTTVHINSSYEDFLCTACFNQKVNGYFQVLCKREQTSIGKQLSYARINPYFSSHLPGSGLL